MITFMGMSVTVAAALMMAGRKTSRGWTMLALRLPMEIVSWVTMPMLAASVASVATLATVAMLDADGIDAAYDVETEVIMSADLIAAPYHFA